MVRQPAGPRTLAMREVVWGYAEPFVIARGSISVAETLEVTLTDSDGCIGRAEAHGVSYVGETPDTMRAQIAAVAPAIEAGADRKALLSLLPAGGARCGVDAALWDLEAKQGLGDPFVRNQLPARPVITGYTIGIRTLDAYEAAGEQFAECAWLKIKVHGADPVAAVEAVRRGAPSAALIVDPNQAWTPSSLKTLAPAMARLGVQLLEQPIPVGSEAELDGWTSPIPLCADESLNDAQDLPRIRGRFQAVNIKLEKAGGLTAALQLADAAVAMGLDLMVGCMGGSSLAMAPGMVLAQRCRFVDLDGPRLLAADRHPGFEFRAGVVPQPHIPELWG